MSTTVVQHVLNRLRDIGVRHVFGAPGDYAFPIDDAVAGHPDIKWVGSCNELNAAYSADGYARIHGVGAVSTTYGVGELSAINGIAGAYTEHLPVFHLVGMPKMPVQTTTTRGERAPPLRGSGPGMRFLPRLKRGVSTQGDSDDATGERNTPAHAFRAAHLMVCHVRRFRGGAARTRPSSSCRRRVVPSRPC
ncbi:thiamine pyrophosphate-binding protein [Streptomyces sp. NPDC002513]